jgi:hypothetical protein
MRTHLFRQKVVFAQTSGQATQLLNDGWQVDVGNDLLGRDDIRDWFLPRVALLEEAEDVLLHGWALISVDKPFTGNGSAVVFHALLVGLEGGLLLLCKGGLQG